MRKNYGMDKPIAINRFTLHHLILLDGATREARGLLKGLKEIDQGEVLISDKNVKGAFLI